ncbi:MAG: hypothetical protein ACRDM7_19535 [Thermoleophilaceae bacterium]
MRRVRGEPDPQPCEESTVDVVCLRGGFGCRLDHDVPVVSAWGTAAILSTSGRPSSDFAGAVE